MVVPIEKPLGTFFPFNLQLQTGVLGGREIPGSLFLLSASGRKRGSQPTQFACAT